MLCTSSNPGSLANSILITNPHGVHDANLDVYTVAIPSSAYVIPGDPASYSSTNLPQSISAQLIDDKTPPSPIKLIIEIHDLQQNGYSLIIERVAILIDFVPSIPRPLNVWVKGSTIHYSASRYKVTYTYTGQRSANVVPAEFVDLPNGYIQLLPREADQLDLEVSSQVVADLKFHVQVTYRLANKSQLHTLMLPQESEVMFLNASDWHEYRLVNGHLVPH